MILALKDLWLVKIFLIVHFDKQVNTMSEKQNLYVAFMKATENIDVVRGF